MHSKITYKIPNGTGFDEFVFDPEAKAKGRYTLNGKSMTGVTSILSAISKPMLVDWAASEAYKESLRLSKEQIQEIIDSKNYIHKRRGDEAKDIGKEAHDWVERYVKALMSGSPIPEMDLSIKHICERFKSWVERNNVKFLASELSIMNRKYFYAGTFDFVCDIGGKIYLGDFKTSSGIYGREYFAQCAAYRLAIEENKGAFLRDGTILDLGNITGSIIVRSDKLTDKEIAEKNEQTKLKYKSDRYAKKAFETAESVEDYPKDVKYFLGALIVYKEGFEYDVDVDELIK